MAKIFFHGLVLMLIFETLQWRVETYAVRTQYCSDYNSILMESLHNVSVFN